MVNAKLVPELMLSILTRTAVLSDETVMPTSTMIIATNAEPANLELPMIQLPIPAKALLSIPTADVIKNITLDQEYVCNAVTDRLVTTTLRDALSRPKIVTTATRFN